MVCGVSPYCSKRVKPLGRIALAICPIILLLLVGDAVVRAGDDAARLPAYQGPCALAVSKDGRTLYVAAADACQVVWVGLPGGKVVRRIAMPTEPTGMALSPDGTRLIVTCAASKSTVVVLDAGSGRQIATIRTGHTATGPAIGPDGKRLYVCNRMDNDLSVIDLVSYKQLARVAAVREPLAAAVTPDGKTVLVANHLPNTRTDRSFSGDVSPIVTFIDTRTHATTSVTLPHGITGVRGLCISPDGKFAIVTHLLSNFEMVPFRIDGGWINVNVVSVLDIRRRKVLYTVGMDAYETGAGNPWDVVCTADGKSVCVSLSGTHELCLIDSADLFADSAKIMSPMMGVWPIYPSLGDSSWRRVKLPGKGPRGLAIAGSKLYVAEYFSDTVAVVDVRTPTDVLPIATAIALGPPPRFTQQRRGELLFHDATICYQHWQSCASCHPDARVDGLNWDLLNDGENNPKNTKSMLLAHQTPPAMAEGVRMSAEDAVRSGIAHILFADRPEEEAAAIDAYLKSLRPMPSPHLVDGRLSPAAQRGRRLFESEQVACHRCHPAPLYTDLRSHNVGSRSPRESTDRFDTPTLIEVWRTAPYLHDGRYATVKELLIEGRHGQRHGGNSLSRQEMEDLVEFVLSL